MDENKLITFLETFQIAEMESINHIDKIGKVKMNIYNIQFKEYPGKVFTVNSKFWYNLYDRKVYISWYVDDKSSEEYMLTLPLTLPQAYRIHKHTKEIFMEQEQRKVRKAVADFYDSISKSK